jgi:choline transport protein
MNWAILVTGAIALISAVYYLVWARKTYHGPVVDIDAQNMGDASIVVNQRHEMGDKL